MPLVESRYIDITIVSKDGGYQVEIYNKVTKSVANIWFNSKMGVSNHVIECIQNAAQSVQKKK